MSQAVHVQTTIQTVLGELDAEGNVVQTFPVNLTIQKLEVGAFQQAHEHLVRARAELAQKLSAGKE